jgi:N-acetyl-gamma-glutamyl-phosphate reductase
MIENDNVVVIDTSTAHRTLDGWCYGFPELSAELDSKLKSAKRIAVPGEMETVLLTETKLKEIDGEITLSLEV